MQYIHDNIQNCAINELICVSHYDAKYKSFRLKVNVYDFQRLLDESLWPIGVNVRRYIPPKKALNNITNSVDTDVDNGVSFE